MVTDLKSRAEVAAALKITRQALEKHIKKGTIVEVAPGRIDIEDAKRRYQTIDPGRKPHVEVVASTPAPRAADGDLVPFPEARAKRENWNAQLAEVKYKEQVGLLVSREEVAAREFAVARKVRDRILGFPARVANFVPPDAMKILVDECDQLVRELQDDAARIAESR